MMDLIPFTILFMMFLSMVGINLMAKSAIFGMISAFWLIVLGAIVLMQKLSYFGIEIESGLPISLSMIIFLFFISIAIYMLYSNAMEL